MCGIICALVFVEGYGVGFRKTGLSVVPSALTWLLPAQADNTAAAAR